MSEYANTKRQELFEKIARERLGRGGGKTRIGADGKTELDPTFNERMVLTGLGNIDASDEMAEINTLMKGMKDTQEADEYLKNNIDKYPELKGYDVTKGKAGALEIVEKEEEFDRGKNYLETTRYGLADLGLDPSKKYTVSTLSPLVAKKEDERDAELRKPDQELAQGKLKLLEQQTTNAQTNSEASLNFQKSQAKEANAFRRHQLEVEGIRAENARRERQFEAAQNREMTREQNKMQLNIAMMDRQDKREDRRIAREDREAEKRQASIYMLIKGLTQLGQGFSI